MDIRSPRALRSIAVAVVGVLLFATAACGDDSSDTTTSAPAAFDLEEARENARGYLGMNEDDLPENVRIGRRGDEQMALTTDLVPGRVTVELDDTDGSGFRVVTAILETPDGSESFDLEPG